MATEKFEKNSSDVSNKDAALKPDQETMHSTDPQEHMEGPVSSVMQSLEGIFDSEKSKEEADQIKDKGM